MKRSDAFRKLKTLCQRLDEDYPHPENSFRVTPLSVWLFGSALSDKAEPEDLDLVIRVNDHRETYTQEELSEIILRLSYGKPLPVTKAVSRWRRGMKMFRIIPWDGTTHEKFEEWLTSLTRLPAETPYKLIWEPELDWQMILNEIETHPNNWDPIAEAKRKIENEKLLKQIKEG